jgi:hypothetical protein
MRWTYDGRIYVCGIFGVEVKEWGIGEEREG